jgi:hypothetical protein
LEESSRVCAAIASSDPIDLDFDGAGEAEVDSAVY